MRWAQQMVGKKRINKCFVAMTCATGMRHFKKGISGVKQWTGREAKEMMKVFIPLLAEDNTISNKLVALIQLIIDFSYIAHATQLTDGELDGLREAHVEMHRLKDSVSTRRLEALRIHQAYLDEYYGKPPTPRELIKTATWVVDDSGDYVPEEDGEEAWEDEEEVEPDDKSEEGNQRRSTSDVNSVEHPAPEFAIVVQPYKRATMSEITDEYSASSFKRALTNFLRPRTDKCFFILPNEEFDVWHKVTLYHRRLSFAPDKPLQRDVIRARPTACGAHNRICSRNEPAFDTALFVHDPHQMGLHLWTLDPSTLFTPRLLLGQRLAPIEALLFQSSTSRLRATWHPSFAVSHATSALTFALTSSTTHTTSFRTIIIITSLSNSFAIGSTMWRLRLELRAQARSESRSAPYDSSSPAHQWGTIVVHHVTHVDGVPSVCITSVGASGVRHGRLIAPDPGGAGSKSQQHWTFKVTLGKSGSLPPPLAPGSAANHARSASGLNGSARMCTMPSPVMGPPHGFIDKDYDAGGAVDALIGLSSY
ncbi:hypothetical protein FRC09_012250 [Ceratobasidium sp. 395]|nr:hypothetical protein FRC09_012250 [Ceratobasidium sp. 395]